MTTPASQPGPPPGHPGHGRGTTNPRLQPTRIIDGQIEGGYTGQWEVICPDCGDSGRLDYSSVSPELQKVRGPYPTQEVAVAYAERHCGLNTEGARNVW